MSSKIVNYLTNLIYIYIINRTLHFCLWIRIYLSALKTPKTRSLRLSVRNVINTQRWNSYLRRAMWYTVFHVCPKKVNYFINLSNLSYRSVNTCHFSLTNLCHIYTVHKLVCHFQSRKDLILPARYKCIHFTIVSPGVFARSGRQ